MKLFRVALLALLSPLFVAANCQDPVVYVPGEYCDNHVPLIAGYQCCADHGLGPGQCPEDTSCMLPDSCTTGPLPPNDVDGIATPMPTHARRGL